MTAITPIDRRLSVAPMMDWTDRHCRYFHRVLSPHALLYTEMVTTGALIHGDADRHLAYNEAEHPVALQLGGNDPSDLGRCATMAWDYGYDEINLNVGCPSDRVQNGQFGACLMAEAEMVARGMDAMRRVVDIPVTVKTRIGIDDQDSYQFLTDFVGTVAEKGGVEVFIIHARKAWLNGLSPKENREIPPLDYDRVYQLKRDFPHLNISINGGIHTPDEVAEHLKHVDGVMLGRAAYQNPIVLSEIERDIFNNPLAISRQDAVRAMIPYIENHYNKGGAVKDITRHMLGLFRDMRGARQWRRYLSENAPHATPETVMEALRFVDEPHRDVYRIIG